MQEIETSDVTTTNNGFYLYSCFAYIFFLYQGFIIICKEQ